MFYIYKITNKINNKIYIGSTNNYKIRWNQHKKNADNKNHPSYNYPLQSAIRKYGIKNFLFEIIKEEEKYQNIIQKEKEYIIYFNSLSPNGYNQTLETISPMNDIKIIQKVQKTKRKNYGKNVGLIENGNIIKKWNSIIECSLDLGIDRFKISAVCNGKRLSTEGKIFKFIDDNENILDITYNPITNYNIINKNSKIIQKIDLNTGEIIKEYLSAAIAGKENNCDSSAIIKACRGKRKTAHGFKWKYKEDELLDE